MVYRQTGCISRLQTTSFPQLCYFHAKNQALMILVPFLLIYTTISNGWFRPAVQEASGMRSAPLRQQWSSV